MCWRTLGGHSAKRLVDSLGRRRLAGDLGQLCVQSGFQIIEDRLGARLSYGRAVVRLACFCLGMGPPSRVQGRQNAVTAQEMTNRAHVSPELSGNY